MLRRRVKWCGIGTYRKDFFAAAEPVLETPKTRASWANSEIEAAAIREFVKSVFRLGCAYGGIGESH